MRRFAPLTNAFSKKLHNHEYVVALYALWYNRAYRRNQGGPLIDLS